MNTFLQTLQTIEKGNLVDDLAEKLAGLIGKVKERGKAGAITLSLKLKPQDADGETMQVVASVKVSEPAKAEKATTFFTTEDNLLVRDNPAQKELKLEPVEKSAAPVAPIQKAG